MDVLDSLWRTSLVRSLVFSFSIVPRNYTRFEAPNDLGPALGRPLISLSGLFAKSATPLGVRDSWAPCTHHPWQKLPYTVTRFCLLPLYGKRKAERPWRRAEASVGSGGVADGESGSDQIGPINLIAKCAGARSEGNPHAAYEVAGAGNGATDTARRARRGKPRIQPSQRPDGPPRQFPTLHNIRGYDSNGAKSNAKGRRLVSLAVSVRLRKGPRLSRSGTSRRVEVAVESRRRGSEAKSGSRAPEIGGLGGSWIPGGRRRWLRGSPGHYVRFIGRSNRALWCSQKPQKNRDTAQSFQRTLQAGQCLIASGPADLSVGFCTVAIVTSNILLWLLPVCRTPRLPFVPPKVSDGPTASVSASS